MHGSLGVKFSPLELAATEGRLSNWIPSVLKRTIPVILETLHFYFIITTMELFCNVMSLSLLVLVTNFALSTVWLY